MSIDEMAQRTGVTTRTIRRDLEALQSAGFPLYDDVQDGKRYWILEHRAFRRLDDTGFTLAELSALYFSRTLVENLAATPFQRDVSSAFDKLAGALTPGMRQFLDRLPLAIQAKAEPGTRVAASGDSPEAKRAAPGTRVAQLLDAILHHRQVQMRYHSFSSNREKEYLIEPYRLVFALGGLYLFAFVPEYSDLRTFAIDRIMNLSVTEERFEPMDLEEDAFAHSLGVHQGTPPERIEVAFDPRDRALREGPHLARHAGRPRPARRRRRRRADGLERLGAAQLDSGVWCAGARDQSGVSWRRRSPRTSTKRGHSTFRG